MRVGNRIASALLGLALIVIGLVLAVDVWRIASGSAPLVLPMDEWYEFLNTTTLSDSWFLAAAVLVGLLGLALLVLELRPWAPAHVRAGAAPDAPWWVSRRSVERRTASAAKEIRGVERVHSQVRGPAKRWRVTVRGQGLPERRDAVVQAVREELDRLYAPGDLPVTVVLRRPRGRVV
jgi:Family of unknown function (DUF6286)